MASSPSSQQEISCILARCDNLAPAQKSGSAQFKCQHSSPQDIDFLHFLSVSCQKHRNEYQMNKNGHTGSDVDAC